MKMVLRIITILFFILFELEAKQIYTFSSIPMLDNKTIYNNFFKMIKYFENELNIKIKFDFSDNYEHLIKKFQNGTIDLAYLGPLPYVILNKEYPKTNPLVHFKNKEGKINYTCSLVTSLVRTQKQKIALTEPLSTCGYLSVNTLLNKKIENFKYKYLKRHDTVALEVLKNHYDLGGIKTDLIQKYHHLGLEEVARTKPFPIFTLVANEQTVSKELQIKIKNLLLNASKEEYVNWGEFVKYGVKEAKDKNYDDIRDMIKNTKIPQKGNF